MPEDDSSQYRTEPHPYIAGALMLAHGSDGNCIYLTKAGCSIHDRAPSLCRSADCRELARSMSFERALALHRAGRLDLRIWDRGRKLLEDGRPM
jgi:Fe-S-cluster containining protein